MNRISAEIRTCEDHLDRARVLLVEIDQHVAGKSFLAHLLYYVSLITGIGETNSGMFNGVKTFEFCRKSELIRISVM